MSETSTEVKMRIGRFTMKPRPYLGYVLLFLVSYAGFLWLSKPVASTTEKLNQTRVAITQEPESRASLHPVENQRSSARATYVQDREHKESANSIPDGNERLTNEQTKAQLPPEQINDWISQATGAVTVEERVSAMKNLNRYGNERDILQAVTVVLDVDTSSRNRAIAVGALVNLAETNSDNSLALNLLQRATRDRDPRVAKRAVMAYNRITGVVEPAQNEESDTAEYY